MACTIIWRERALPMLLSSKRRSLYVLCTPGLGRSCCFYLAHDFELDYVALLCAYCLALDYELMTFHCCVTALDCADVHGPNGSLHVVPGRRMPQDLLNCAFADDCVMASAECWHCTTGAVDAALHSSRNIGHFGRPLPCIPCAGQLLACVDSAARVSRAAADSCAHGVANRCG